MSDSVRPHRWQPTRLPHPWDSPGKNSGVGCHFLLQCRKVKSESEVAQSCPTLSDPMDCSLLGSSVHGFSRQEYWSGMLLPSAHIPLIHLTMKFNFYCDETELRKLHAPLTGSPGKNTGMGCHDLLQGIFQTQELNFHLLSLLH